MAISNHPDIEIETLRSTIEKRAEKARGSGLAWALFLLVGMPLGLMAALGPLTTIGVYLEFLRPLWRPWPPDPWKPFIGIAGFAATLAYLAFRRGIFSGFRRGTIATMAAIRNLLEGRTRPASVGPSPPPPAAEAVGNPGNPALPPPPNETNEVEIVAR